MTSAPIDLKARAHQAMLEAGFRPDFPADVLQEVQLLKQGAPKNNGPAVRDLRSLLWSSIDNDSSCDLDQVEYVEKLPDGATRLLVGIADVDASVHKGSATDRQAAAERAPNERHQPEHSRATSGGSFCGAIGRRAATLLIH